MKISGEAIAFIVISSFLILPICFSQDQKSEKAAVALDRMNQYRTLLGLVPVHINDELKKAAQAHADYCVINNYQGHNEEESKSSFTGAMPWDRAKKAGFGFNLRDKYVTEDVTYLGDPSLAVDIFIDSVYHRLPVIRASTEEIGYGYASQKFAADVVDFSDRINSSKDYYIIYPQKDQFGVPVFFGEETPNPRADGSNVSGYPITFTVNFSKPGATIECTEHSLVDSKGNKVDYFLDTPQDDPGHMLKDTIAIVPKAVLKLDEKYTVTINAKASTGKEIKNTWSFTTGRYRDLTFIDFKSVGLTSYDDMKKKAHQLELIYFLEELDAIVDIDSFLNNGVITDYHEILKRYYKLGRNAEWRSFTDNEWTIYTNKTYDTIYNFHKPSNKLVVKEPNKILLDVSSGSFQLRDLVSHHNYSASTLKELIAKIKDQDKKSKEKK